MVKQLDKAIPSWEMTKYYGRICVFQLRCIKYRIQTSEAWFNFKCKFMPSSIKADESKSRGTDPCDSQNNEKQASVAESKPKMWLSKKLSETEGLTKLEEKKKWLPFGRGSKDRKC
ncbi:uncharacterized protein LOC124407295 [Diprion similis]|uniref:uncharacterized protein LOC124407295 n=1 Tax=Diprion similis TaxID=362088 RepID=UPI001EF9744C|nr:uncharacterized protein LOC124407295 [Diprion similis]